MEEEDQKNKVIKQGDADTDVSDDENGEEHKKDEKWGDIIPLDSRKFSPFECFKNEVTIGRAANNVL